MPNILLTGATGRLGSELKQLRDFAYMPSHRAGEWDITRQASVNAYCLDKDIDLIVHLAAYTHVEAAELHRELAYFTNVLGTAHLEKLNIPMLTISTEYAADPLNYYAHTKRKAEEFGGKVLRLSFKARPFPYKRAFTDQWTTGDYIDIIAQEVNTAIELYPFLPELTNIGTERKTIFDLAKQSRPDVLPMSRLEITTAVLPEDTSLDCTDWYKLKAQYV